MTSESNPPEPQEESAIENATASAKAAFENSGLSGPTGLVALGGLILLGIWLIGLFSLPFRLVSGSHLVLVLAVAAVALHFGKAEWLSGLAPKTTLFKTIGYTLGVIAFFNIVALIGDLGDIRTTTMLAWLLSIAGMGVAFIGARQIEN